MKKVLAMFLSVVLIFLIMPFGSLPLSVSAANEYKDGLYTYTVENGIATIVRVDRSISGDVIIPNVLGGYEVTNINDYAFNACYSVSSIVIPNSVRRIGMRAIYNCLRLKSITISDGVIDIGERAFEGCSMLTSIFIPKSVTSIGENAFYTCYALKKIDVDDNNKNYCSIDGVLFNKDVTVMKWYPAGKTDISYKIPNSVISVGARSFYGCENTTNINMGSNVTKICDGAFIWCKNLTSITIPENVVEIIGDMVFRGCYNLTIYGCAGSCAEAYANEYDIQFALKKQYIPGDINGDTSINNKDLGILMQYLNGWEVETSLEASDVNADGNVNNKDYGLLMQYLNGWDVELQ